MRDYKINSGRKMETRRKRVTGQGTKELKNRVWDRNKCSLHFLRSLYDDNNKCYNVGIINIQSKIW